MGVWRGMDFHHALLHDIHGHSLEQNKFDQNDALLRLSMAIECGVESCLFLLPSNTPRTTHHCCAYLTSPFENHPVSTFNERRDLVNSPLFYLVVYRYFFKRLYRDLQLT